MESDSKSDSSGEICVADIVLNLNGRDGGRLYFVIEADGEYLSLADGSSRKLEFPKRKKLKHVKPVAKSSSRAAEALRKGTKVTNAELRRALHEFLTAQASEEV